MWCAWRQHVSAARGFQQVLTAIGSSILHAVMSEALTAWRDVVRAKQWKAVWMMRWVAANLNSMCIDGAAAILSLWQGSHS
jgi:hypothetical protein